MKRPKPVMRSPKATSINSSQTQQGTSGAVQRALRRDASPVRARQLQRYFKTARGEYGEGDIFIGLTVPLSRKIAERYSDLPLAHCRALLLSKLHEARLVALMILSGRYASLTSSQEKQRLCKFYLQLRTRVNNWDLVDSSAPYILGTWLLENPRKILYQLARSNSLWDRRISMVATLTLIRAGFYSDTFRLAEIFLSDPEDLMHKACGWMLREVGKRDKTALISFLKRHHTRMPRTMLRYSLEHFGSAERKKFMKR